MEIKYNIQSYRLRRNHVMVFFQGWKNGVFFICSVLFWDTKQDIFANEKQSFFFAVPVLFYQNLYFLLLEKIIIYNEKKKRDRENVEIRKGKMVKEPKEMWLCCYVLVVIVLLFALILNRNNITKLSVKRQKGTKSILKSPS